MFEHEDRFVAACALLDSCGVLSDVLIVGSWAEVIYMRAGILPDFCPDIRTMDVDFLVRNLRRPSTPVNILKEARARGYAIDRDRVNGITKMVDTKGVEVEFLLGKVGAGLEVSLPTNFGVTAQTLRHLDILKSGAMTVSYSGMDVCVPSPEATSSTRWSSTPSAARRRTRTLQP